MASRKTKARKSDPVPLIDGMTNEELLQAMETLVKALGLECRYEKGDFKGGLCRVHEQQLIVLQKKESLENKVKTLAAGLGELDLTNVYVMPAIQEMIDSARKEPVQNGDLSIEEE
ncbi:hypothetical protein GF406_23900 [candidate division KSB1 bacterium]|nr:hypothetical protein [candidate division KSB1 bacterium]